MIDDFKSAPRRPKSLQAALDDLPGRQTPAPNTFRTPDETAALDSHTAATPLIESPHPAAPEPAGKQPGKRWHHRLALRWPPSKKEYIVGAIVIVLIVSGVASWVLTHRSAPPAAAVQKVKQVKQAPKSTTVPSALTGLPVDPSVNARPVTAVMIENSVDARPQAGLSQAGVVFEAVAEGGVTRFMALYQDTQPDNVGPIRSARPYYIQWALGFDADYAHVGGSPDALADIKSWGVKDLDEFYNGSYYHRISTRAAPHNVYTAITTLNQLETSKGYTSSTFTSWPRKPEAPSKQPTATTIKMALSGPTYDPSYTYDASTNSYNRSEDGAPQTDANTGAQISPKVVIAIVVPESQGALDSSGAYYSDYNPIGSGTAYIFQDGTVTTGQWSKASNTAQLLFTDASGQPIKLDPGQAWITAITSPNNLSYTP